MTKRAYLFEIWRTDDFDRKERKQLEHAKKQWRRNVAPSSLIIVLSVRLKFPYATKYLFTLTPAVVSTHCKTNQHSFTKVTATATPLFLLLPKKKREMTELAFPVAEKVIEKLGSLAYQEISLTRSIESDLKKLGTLLGWYLTQKK